MYMYDYTIKTKNFKNLQLQTLYYSVFPCTECSVLLKRDTKAETQFSLQISYFFTTYISIKGPCFPCLLADTDSHSLLH